MTGTSIMLRPKRCDAHLFDSGVQRLHLVAVKAILIIIFVQDEYAVRYADDHYQRRHDTGKNSNFVMHQHKYGHTPGNTQQHNYYRKQQGIERPEYEY